MKVSLIAAQSRNRVIGQNNQLPWHIPEDLRFFKQTTLGKPIIMGRKTFDSIGRPLPGRLNIVVTRDNAWQRDGVVAVESVEAALDAAKAEASTKQIDEVMVVGGAEIYRLALPYADCLYLTEIDIEIDGDAHFPALDSDQWQLVESCTGNDVSVPYPYRFNRYSRKG